MSQSDLTYTDLSIQKMHSVQKMKQAEYNFADVTNFKEFFIKNDGISHAGYETFISVFRRYKCEAGCDICYINDRWVDKSGKDYFPKYVPDSITEEMETRILDAFDHFQTVSTIDDIFYVKHKHPALFEFYTRNCRRINLTSMTDMALIQQTPIAINDLNFNSVYDITISDTFVQSNIKYAAVIKSLEALYEKYALVKLRFIVSTDPTLDRTNLIKIIRWAKDRGIYTSGTNDNQGDWFFVNKVMELFDHTESAFVMHEKELHQIYTEVTHLMLDRWVVSFYQSTQDEDLSFYQLDSKLKPDLWLESLLREKLRQYDNSRKVMIRNEHNANYFDFFNYAADNVVVHDSWNFIPKLMFDQTSSKYYSKLIAQGFTELPQGLIRTSTLINHDNIVPIYSFKG